MADEALLLLDGLGRSLLVTAIGVAVGLAIGIAAGAARHARTPVLSRAVAAYVNLFRCTPLLVQVTMLYFALPDLGVSLTPFAASWVALGLWGGSYQAEVFRAGFDAVPKGEVIAARALGMTAAQAFLDVTLPLGLRTSLPAATTTAITQFRSSSFMVVIGYAELTYTANRIVSETFDVFTVFGMASVMYLAVCLSTGLASRRLERAWAVPGLGAAP